MAMKLGEFRHLIVCAMVLCSTATQAEPIHEAAFDGNAELVEQLLSEGADVNAPDPTGTPLQWALFAGQEEVARVLLEHGADPNVEGEAGAPLQMAISGGNAEMVELLLDHGANPNVGHRSTPLVAAARIGSLEIIKLLLQNDADPNFSTIDGTTGLHEAAGKGALDIVELLVEQGADVNALTTAGKPPIHFAMVGNHLGVADYLREQSAASVEIAPIADLLASANLAQGESEAEVCAGCHLLKGDAIYRAPSLWDIVGRSKASAREYDYSPAFTTLKGDWTFEALNRFLARPFEVVPGTKMEFFGEEDPQKRANLIAYLRTLSDNPVPLP